MISNLLFQIRDLNQACKEYHLRADSGLTSITIGAAVLLIFPMAFLDYYYYQFSLDFFEAIIFESLFSLFSIWIIYLLRRNNLVKTYENLSFTWVLAFSIFALIFTLQQQSRIVENCLFCLLFLMANFFFIQNKILFRIIPAAVIYFSFLSAILTNHVWFSFQNKFMFTLMFVVLTAVGIIVIGRNNHFKETEFNLQKEEREARLLYENLAMTDALTGIPNRRYFFEQAGKEWELHNRYASFYCIAILDLDRFKQVNDRYGHAKGDEILKLYSHLMTLHTRATDTIARIGGEEFAFLFRETHETDAMSAVNRLRDSVAALMAQPQYSERMITFSAGITEVQPEDQFSDDPIRRADQALYRAKELGRDQIVAA